jgi:hypothetical protein
MCKTHGERASPTRLLDTSFFRIRRLGRWRIYLHINGLQRFCTSFQQGGRKPHDSVGIPIYRASTVFSTEKTPYLAASWKGSSTDSGGQSQANRLAAAPK